MRRAANRRRDEVGEKLGASYARGLVLLMAIRNYTDSLIENGFAAAALPEASMAILERAARGEAMPEEELLPVLEAAEKLEDHLAWEFLAIPYDLLCRRLGAKGRKRS